MLVDEADSLLIDEARTPLILSGTPPGTATLLAAGCRWGAALVPHFQEKIDYDFDPSRRHLELNGGGRQGHQRSARRPAVGAAGGMKATELKRVERLLEAGADCIVVDIAHGDLQTGTGYHQRHSQTVLSVLIIGGNVASADGRAFDRCRSGFR